MHIKPYKIDWLSRESVCVHLDRFRERQKNGKMQNRTISQTANCKRRNICIPRDKRYKQNRY